MSHYMVHWVYHCSKQPVKQSYYPFEFSFSLLFLELAETWNKRNQCTQPCPFSTPLNPCKSFWLVVNTAVFSASYRAAELIGSLPPWVTVETMSFPMCISEPRKKNTDSPFFVLTVFDQNPIGSVNAKKQERSVEPPVHPQYSKMQEMWHRRIKKKMLGCVVWLHHYKIFPSQNYAS